MRSDQAKNHKRNRILCSLILQVDPSGFVPHDNDQSIEEDMGSRLLHLIKFRNRHIRNNVP